MELKERETETAETESPEQQAINQIPVGPSLSRFKTADGPFGWFAHGVTGEEMNRFVMSVQQHLSVHKESIADLYDRNSQIVEKLGELDQNTVQQIKPLIEATNRALTEANELKAENARLQKKVKLTTWLCVIALIVGIVALVLKITMG